MEITQGDLKYSLSDDNELHLIFIETQIAKWGTNHWVGRIKMVLDSGSSEVLIPRAMLNKLKLIDVEMGDEKEILDANGNFKKCESIKLDFRINSTKAGQPIIFSGVNVVIVEEGALAILGMPIISKLDLVLKSGKVALLQLADPSKK
jgi:predicted aspartyl protease